MKIPASVRRIYEEQLERSALLQSKVDERLKALKEQRWHYESRLKDVESFLLKLESGRFGEPQALEDFFACTLVVENARAVARAESLTTKTFVLKYRRPHRDGFTHKQPEQFPFDDLRLYVGWRDDPALPTSTWADLTFEVQIKTFLQHAWTIATHDLTYKTNEIHWGKQRITYQVKAILEHAEISIQEAETLARSEGLKKTNQANEKLKKMVALAKDFWRDELLPQDVRRLAQNIGELCDACSLDAPALRRMLAEEAKAGRGPATLNLSPFGVVVQTLLQRRQDAVIRLLSEPGRDKRILIPSEVELPAGLDRSACINGRFV